MSKGKIEADLNALISKFYKKGIGRGPKRIKSRIVEDMLIIRIFKYPEPIVELLKNHKNGIDIFVQLSRAIFESSEPLLRGIIQDFLGFQIKRSFYDENLDGNEITMLFIFEENIEEVLKDLEVII
ncbi:DUF2294 domain-containing protein [Tepidibacillus marianensis]|uniref:DUF2294 domain-containing protein n=1 Tax=Tepidibacillus marianensis TaxID=3131995 RepID=UPI0030CB7364